MLAEVIAIGDELTSGERLDTNTQWLSQQLTASGLEVMFHTTVGDDMAANVQVFRSAIKRAEVVVCTGGLGPTADDLTREAIAEALGVQLALDKPSLDHIRQLFASRGRTMPERNERQAYLPEGAVPIPNPSGTAPGVEVQASRGSGAACRLFALPGVPAEMHEMFMASVLPAVLQLPGERRVTRHRAIKVFGPGESQLEAMLPDIVRRGREPRVGITASGATLTLRITASGADEAECAAKMAPTAKSIYQAAGKYVFGEGDIDLHHALLKLLQEREETLATHECFTRGLVAFWLADIDPENKHFVGGRMSAKVDEVATAARAARDELGATYGLAIGSPLDASEVEVAIAVGDNIIGDRFKLSGHPAVVGPRIAKISLNMLRLNLS